MINETGITIQTLLFKIKAGERHTALAVKIKDIHNISQ